MTRDVIRRLAELPPDKRRVLAQTLRERGAEYGVFPLSPAQQRLWFIDQLAPGSHAYNAPVVLALNGALDAEALAGSLQALVDRHEALRTAFLEIEGAPVQVVEPSAPAPLEVESLEHVPADEREARVRAAAEAVIRRPFDLGRPPLVRATLLRLGPEEHVLVWVTHYIAFDGSLPVLLRDLSALYQARLGGHAPALPPLRIQYADYALWQQQHLRGPEAQAQLGWWRERLAGAPRSLELPTDRPPPATQSFRGGSHRFSVPAEVAERVRELARGEGATLFMAALAAFQALLHRYTGAEDVLVGTPVASRGRPELEELIGCFINSVVIRTDLGGNPSFRALLGRVREAALGAQAHQDVPFERLVEELAPERSLGQNPLFQVMLVLHERDPLSELRLPGVSAAHFPADPGRARFPLLLVLAADEDGGIGGSVEYGSDLFDPPTVARLAEHLVNLLAAASADPDGPIAALPLLSPAEERRIVWEWNDTARPYARGARIHDLFEAHAAEAPDAPAVIDAQGSVTTYGELDALANRVAGLLGELGVGRGDFVGIHLERSAEMVPALLGVLKAGAAYVPIDTAYPEARVEWIVDALGVRCLLTQGPLLPSLRGIAERVPGLAHAVCLDSDTAVADRDTALRVWTRAELDARAPAKPADPSQAGDLAYVIFTSGSTGTPKGVMVRHRPVVNLIEWVNRELGVGPADRVLFVTSLCFDLSVYDVFGLLAAGGSIRVAAREEVRDPERLAGILRDEPVTFWDSAPAALQQAAPFFPAPGAAPHAALRLVFLSGDWIPVPLPDQVRSAFSRARVIALGGATEATVWSNFYPVGRVEPQWRSIPYGRPIQNARYYVLDPRLRPCPVGIAGDLFIGGECLADGYLGAPALTAQKFIPDPFGVRPGAVMYRTGDRARFFADGNLEFLGRVDHQVKIRGFRIELGEIESVLLELPEVRECVVAVREDAPGDRRLAAYVVPAAGAAPAAGELRAAVRVRLPEYMVPSAFVVLGALPLTANGKVDRKALPAPDFARPELEQPYTPPRTPAERALAEIWAELLRVERVGVEDNFFELGGDSILGLQVVARARAAGVRITPRHLFLHQTVAELAAVAERDRAPDAAPASAAPAESTGGEVPLTPAQAWLFAQGLAAPHHFNQALLLELHGEAARLPESAWRAVVATLLERHEALRLRFAPADGAWRARVAAPDAGSVPYARVDLAALEAGERRARLEAACAERQGSLSLEHGPLLRAVHFDLGDGEPERLLLAIHHLAVDGVSWRVLLADLAALLRQAAAGEPLALPSPATPWSAWTRRLADFARTPSPLLERARGYWGPLASVPAPALPRDHADGANTVATLARVDAALTAEETRALLGDAHRAYRTRTDELLLCALARTLQRWTGRDAAWVDLEGHGREEIVEGADLSRTVGWFTSFYPLRLRVPAGAGPGEALRAVKEQARAVPDRGVGFGMLRHLSGDAAAREAMAAVPAPAVVFNYLGRFDQEGFAAEGALRPAAEGPGPLRAPRNRRAHLLEVGARVVAGRLEVSWGYSRALHDEATIRGLAERFLDEVRALVEHCLRADAGGYTPSDFPLAGVPQGALDRLRGRYGEIADLYPLSGLQEGMLFHSVRADAGHPYHVQLLVSLRGLGDPARFRRAWAETLRRHPALRTCFVWEGVPRPLQVVLPRAEAEWAEEDWRALDGAGRDEAVADRLARDRARGFDLAAAPPLRFALWRTGEDAYELLWSHHHLLVDGWSLPRVFAEVFARCRGEEPAEGGAPPYREYIAWLRGRDRAGEEAYWRGALAGFTAATPLGGMQTGAAPSDAPSRYAEAHHRLAPELTAAVDGLARRLQVTPNTVLQGAWALVLSRHAREEDVVFGATVSGRPAELPGVERMVGLFVNTLPVRVRARGSRPVAEWLRELQARQAEARDHQYTPLAEVQGWSEVPRGEPLFESLFAFENYPVDAALWKDGEAEGPRIGDARAVERTGYPLTLTAGAGAELRLKAVYDERRFEAAGAARLLGELERVLEQFAASPGRRLGEVVLLGEAERRQALGPWSRSSAAPPPYAPVHVLFARQAAQTPDAQALTYRGIHLTYDELNRRANRLAHHLRGLGVGPDARVGVALRREPELVVSLLAILKAGGAYVPLDPEYPPERLAFMLRDGSVSLVLTREALLERLPVDSGARVLSLDGEAEAVAAHDERNLQVEVSPEDAAYVIYTSGSTGEPKGTVVPHRAIPGFFWGEDYVRFGPGEAVLQHSSTSWDALTLELWPALLAGGRCVLYPGDGVTHDGFEEAVRAEGVTTAWITAALFNSLLDTRPSALEGLTQVMTGGEAVSAEHVRRAHARFPGMRVINGYGPSECTVFATCQVIPRGFAGAAVPIGTPVGDRRVYLLDPEMNPVPTGVAGEVFVGGPAVPIGYLGRPGLTAERLVPDPFAAEPGARLYRTGDLARRGEDGTLEFVGRVDFQLKLRGFRVEPEEVERALAAHPAVREAVVVPRDERLVAYVVAEEEAEADPRELRTYLRARLPEYMVPAVVVPLDALPLTRHGKVDRRALPAPEHAAEERRDGAPATPAQEILAGVWAEVLGMERVGVHDDFFALGGHSLRAMQVVSRAREIFGVDLPLTALFEAPTVAGLAEAVEQAAGTPLPPVRRREGDAPVPLSFAQQRLWVLDQLEPESPVYNIPMALRLEGELDAGALQGALSELAARHEALRTVFPLAGGAPVQRVLPPAPLPLPVEDAAGLAPDALERRVHAEVRAPFDLARGPLLRARLLRLGQREHVLLLVMHHIVSDGWSLRLLFTELSALYGAFLRGEPSPLARVPVQYADHALWQREHLRGETLRRELAWWRGALAGAPPALELPAERPKAAPGERGAVHRFRVDAELAARARGWSRAEGVTLFMALLAAYQLLLARESGADDVVVGTPVAGRTRPEVEGVVGFFVNTLALRVRLGGDPTVREVLARVREAALGAYRHQELPFDKLVEELRPERRPGRAPVTQTRFVLQDHLLPELRLEGLAVSLLAAETGTAKHELMLYLTEGADGLAGTWEYDRALFRIEVIERMSRAYTALLEAMIADPEQRLSALFRAVETEEEGGAPGHAPDDGALEEARLGRFRTTRRRAVAITAETEGES